MIGIDEAGRGPVIGPLVVAAVQIDDKKKLEKLGVKDSKKLTPRKREEILKSIQTVAKISIVEMDAKEIDESRRSNSLNEIEVKMFVKAVLGLDYRGEKIIVDSCDVNEKRFGENIKKFLVQANVVSRHRADETYACVSAASIVAKVKRDEKIRALDNFAKKQWGIGIGSGYQGDPKTISFLKMFYKKYRKMPDFVRHSWKTLDQVYQSTLDTQHE
ncbi:MAG: ribonuclease HII [Candidatus Methanofastidiosia archaeon]